MRADVVRTYRDIHSWTGIVCGLLLFIAFYAGALTMFEAPLQRWASPPSALPEPVALADAQALVDATLAAKPEAARAYHVHVAPGPELPARVSWPAVPRRSRDDPGPVVDFGAALTADGEWVSQRLEAAPVADLIDRLHRQVGLPLPHEPAMIVTGIVGLLYALALISGLVAFLPRLRTELFALRLGTRARRLWLDVHNALGVVSLPFHVVIALSVVVFAFHDGFYAAQDAVVYDGGLKQQWAQGRTPPPQRDPDAVPLSPAELLERIVAQAPGFEPARLEYATDPEGRLGARVIGADPRYAMRGPTFGLAEVDPYDGRLLQDDYLPGRSTGYAAVVANFFALHFGSFGGNPVRWAYFVLGLAGAFLFYTGNLLWIEGRRPRARRDAPEPEPDRVGRTLRNLTVGVALGCIAGISATLAATKWLPGRVANPGIWHEAIFYAVFLGAIAWAFLRGAERGTRELLLAAGLATAAIPATSVVGVVAPALGPWNWGDGTWLVDAVAAIGAVAFCAGALRRRARVSVATG